MSFDPAFDDVMLMMPLNPSSSVSEIYLPSGELTITSKALGATSSATGINNYPSSWTYSAGNNVVLESGAQLSLKNLSLTAEAWCKLTTPGSTAAQNGDSQYIARCYENLGNFINDVILGIDRSGKPFAFLGNNGSACFATGANSVTANTWFHLAMVFSHSTKKLSLYLNGVLAASNTATATDPAFFR
ncbi:LamG-like jellyroll fold domain-containing protein [Comamonas sp. SY3]|uniref:LamG-like jellyroll fold domain-containing protein n=1 Tax=Comamonas sp. SY3 TaxID=3243601 RepID=UPI00359366B0